ncbi:type VI secretion system accessory protein TagJ [Thiocystis violascens]|uniref:Protein of avirulence locus involved in temperature-dependent protein secretion n=1 Tax=Thiocystis violascens (strain ATCC 17096 / DSM 198 / 6111) TaxID=765911 RepID=I3YB66_THIV6|nr:type VI secretion system accessory protein TagJ [Thiocystis violascens]AFL74234.1 protein of avirulence locus involved in temperature-dependent protein secretion [Thiocystis violascens DSM 198]
MLAEDRLREGDLEGTLRQLQEQVRKDPANASYRVFLFQLLALMGQWERALNQLGVAGELDASTLAMVQTYREALRCEVLRGKIFEGRQTPLIFGRPDAWVALLLEAHRLIAQGAIEQANAVREQALEAAPTTSGAIDGTPFDWIMDADARLGPVLEAIVNGRYYWIPFQCIRSIAVEKPEDLRDLVWMPAHFTWANGGETVGLIPTRYPGAESHPDQLIRLARKTDWLEPAPGLYLGQGQRMLTTDAGDSSLMDVRRIDLDAPDAAGSARG